MTDRNIVDLDAKTIPNTAELDGMLPRPSKLRRQLPRLLQGVSGFALILTMWWAVVELRNVPTYIMPPPDLVFRNMLDQLVSGDLFIDAKASLGRLAIAFGAAIAISIPLGFLMGFVPTARRMLEPVVLVYQSIPGIAWIPLAIVWFGISSTAVAFVIFSSMVGLITYSVLRGVVTLPSSYRNAILALGGGHKHVLFYVYLPGTLPSIVTGVRIGVATGWRALVAAELVAATSGLGFRIFQAQQFLDITTVVSGMVFIGLAWLLMDNALLRPLERRTVERWGTVSAS